MFTRERHPEPDESVSPPSPRISFTAHFTVIVYQRLGFTSSVFSVRFFPTKTSCAFSSLSRLLHALTISSSSIWSR